MSTPTFIENILAKNFLKMPLWVRVVAYIAFLIVYIYLLLAPSFISVRFYHSTPDGHRTLFRSGLIEMNVQDHRFKFTINEDGDVSIPVVSKVPGTTRIQLHLLDPEDYKDIDIKYTERLFGSIVEFMVDEENGQTVVKRVANGEPSRILAWFGVESAIAGEIAFPQALNAPSLSPVEAADIHSKVVSIVARAAKKPEKEVKDDLVLEWAKGFPLVVKLLMVEGIENEFQIKVPDEHWEALKTVGEVVNYVEKRKILDKIKPSAGARWPDYRQSFPKEQQPQFVLRPGD